MELYFLLGAGLSPTQYQGSHEFGQLRLGDLKEWRLATILVQDAHIEMFHVLAAIRVPQHQEWL